MLEQRFIKIALWIVLILAIYLQVESLQLASVKLLTLMQLLLINFVNLATGGLDFVIQDAAGILTEELEDMTPEDNATYDFIVVGAGSAGAAVAARLSEAKNVTVLLLEAGIQETAIVDVPILAIYLQLSKIINWNYSLEASPKYCRAMKNKQCLLPRGKVMGGSSCLNFMIASRGNSRDYDTWANMGCDGWSWNDVLPIFKKMENFEVIEPTTEMEYHGNGGPLNVGMPSIRTKAAEAFVQAGLELGYPYVDYNGKEQIGYSFIHSTTKNGSRFSSNRAYLYPVKGRQNLFVSKESYVNKLLIDEETKTVYGVSITKKQKTISVLARKEVIVCAGAINSPQLLMLSGIGPSEHLKKFNIPVIKNLPVGENLMDHVSYWGFNFLLNESVSFVTKDVLDVTNSAIPDYLASRTGVLTLPGSAEALSFLDVDNSSAREGTPNMELIFTSATMSSDPLFHLSLAMDDSYYDACYKSSKDKPTFMVVPTLLKPKSRGKVELRSNDPKDKVKVDVNYYDDPDDMRIMILGLRETMKLIQTQALKKYNTKPASDQIPGCENFEKDSDEFWECAANTFSTTLYHPSGTCKMGAESDPTAVVNPRLKVIGIKGLRVADASIMPDIIAGHTNLPSIMIGEKLAQMVKEDWSLN